MNGLVAWFKKINVVCYFHLHLMVKPRSIVLTLNICFSILIFENYP